MKDSTKLFLFVIGVIFWVLFNAYIVIITRKWYSIALVIITTYLIIEGGYCILEK